jgi:hypothetical protein
MSIILRDGTNAGQLAAISSGGAIRVDGSAVTQPVSFSGSMAVTGTVTVAPDLPTGALYTSNTGVGIFDDTFTSLDTTNRWNAPVLAGGGVTAAVVAGNGCMTLGTGTTANGYSYITTQAVFQQAAPGFLLAQAAVNLEFPLTANTYRFWGFGNPVATPTAAAPLIDAIGWEVSTAGKMYAICYADNARQIVQDLSVATGNSKQPVDANVHKYILYYRGDLAYWAVDALSNIVATMPTGALGPVNNTLAKICMAVAGSTAPSSSGVLTMNSLWLGDTTNQPLQLSDGIYAWRKATVKPASAAAIATDTALVVSVSPNSAVTIAGQVNIGSMPSSGNVLTVNTTTPFLAGPATLLAANATTTVCSSVAANTGGVTLLSSNSTRKGYSCFNDGTATLYLCESGSASTTNYTVQIPPLGLYEGPVPVTYTAITGIWSAASGSARMTERY